LQEEEEEEEEEALFAIRNTRTEEEERGLIKDLKRHGQLAVAWDRHGSPVPRWTLSRYDLDKTPTLLALQPLSLFTLFPLFSAFALVSNKPLSPPLAPLYLAPPWWGCRADCAWSFPGGKPRASG
jgi:hypothetical protein